MQLVLWCLVVAGGRSDPVAHLLDLMIAVEALVEITGAGRGSTGSSGTRLGRRIAGLAGVSRALGVDPGDVEVFMSRATAGAGSGQGRFDEGAGDFFEVVAGGVGGVA
jgi:hypothetical protein